MPTTNWPWGSSSIWFMGSLRRDAKVPLFRFGFPVFDRVNMHRSPIIGYQGVIRMVTDICNKFIDIVDETSDDRHFEMMR